MFPLDAFRMTIGNAKRIKWTQCNSTGNWCSTPWNLNPVHWTAIRHNGSNGSNGLDSQFMWHFHRKRYPITVISSLWELIPGWVCTSSNFIPREIESPTNIIWSNLGTLWYYILHWEILFKSSAAKYPFHKFSWHENIKKTSNWIWNEILISKMYQLLTDLKLSGDVFLHVPSVAVELLENMTKGTYSYMLGVFRLAL